MKRRWRRWYCHTIRTLILNAIRYRRSSFWHAHSAQCTVRGGAWKGRGGGKAVGEDGLGGGRAPLHQRHHHALDRVSRPGRDVTHSSHHSYSQLVGMHRPNNNKIERQSRERRKYTENGHGVAGIRLQLASIVIACMAGMDRCIGLQEEESTVYLFLGVNIRRSFATMFSYAGMCVWSLCRRSVCCRVCVWYIVECRCECVDWKFG